MITWPSNTIGFIDWADSLKLTRPDIQPNYRVDSEDDWQDWATRLLQSQACINADAPRPQGFDDWRRWAERFVAAFGVNA